MSYKDVEGKFEKEFEMGLYNNYFDGDGLGYSGRLIDQVNRKEDLKAFLKQKLREGMEEIVGENDDEGFSKNTTGLFNVPKIQNWLKAIQRKKIDEWFEDDINVTHKE